jgi:hypothetical protein
VRRRSPLVLDIIQRETIVDESYRKFDRPQWRSSPELQRQGQDGKRQEGQCTLREAVNRGLIRAALHQAAPNPV